MDLQIRDLECLAHDMFSSPDAGKRTAARHALQPFLGNSPSCIPQCQLLLDRSANPEALLLAATTLLEIITTSWNRFQEKQTIEMRNYLLTFLATPRPVKLPGFVNGAIIRLLCRITKLGWLDSSEHRAICQEVAKLLRSTPDHQLIALEFLSEFVSEMPAATKSIAFATNRKIITSFRMDALLHIMNLAVNIVQGNSNANRTNSDHVRSLALDLVSKCLTANVTGSQADEALEEFGALMIPDGWKSMFDHNGVHTMMIAIIFQAKDEEILKCLDVLSCFVRTRRSIFVTEISRTIFLNTICTGMVQMAQRANELLTYPGTLTYFARLAYNLKSTYQLSDLASISTYREWLAQMADISAKSFKISHDDDATSYFLKFWCGITRAVRFKTAMRPDHATAAQPTAERGQTMTSHDLDQLISRMGIIFLEGQVDVVTRYVARKELDDFLDEGRIADQLDSYQAIFRHDYSALASHWVLLFTTHFNDYQKCTNGSPDDLKRRSILLGQLAWLTKVAGGVIGCQRISMTRPGSDLIQYTNIDAQILYRIMACMQFESHYIPLEEGIIECLDQIRTSYLVDPESTMNISRKSLIPIFFAGLSELFGSPLTQQNLVDAMITKSIRNLSEFSVLVDDSTKQMPIDNITSVSIALIDQLGSNTHTSRLMKKFQLPSPFMASHNVIPTEQTLEIRFHFYSCWSRLLLSEVADADDDNTAPWLPSPAIEQTFQTAMADISRRFQALSEASLTAAGGEVERAIPFICADIMGCVASCQSTQNFGVMYNWILPRMSQLHAIMSKAVHKPLICQSVLRLLLQLSTHSSRPFPGSSSNGCRLLILMAPTLQCFAKSLLAVPAELQDGLAGAPDTGIFTFNTRTIPERPSPRPREAGEASPARTQRAGSSNGSTSIALIQIYFDIVCRAINGDWVDLGPMGYYRDRTGIDLIQTAIALMLNGPLPIGEVLARVDMSKVYFQFVGVVFEQYFDMVLDELPAAAIRQMVLAVFQGADATDVEHDQSALCTNIVGTIFNYRVTARRRSRLSTHERRLAKLNEALRGEHDVHLDEALLESFLTKSLFDGDAAQDPIAFALLPILLTTNAAKMFERFVSGFLANQPSEVSLADVRAALDKLSREIRADCIGEGQVRQLAGNLRAVRAAIVRSGAAAVPFATSIRQP